MSVTAYKTPGTAATVSAGYVAWVSPDSARAEDDSGAYAVLDKNNIYTDWLRLTNYGFTSGDIPLGATIDGIEVKIRRKESVGAGHYIYETYIYLRKTSGQVGSNKSSGTQWPTSFTDKTYGGATDKWGATLSQSDIVSTDFGIDLSSGDITESPGNGIPYVDLISIRVYYTEITGWANIAKVKGATATDFAKCHAGIAVADIAKRRGAAV